MKHSRKLQLVVAESFVPVIVTLKETSKKEKKREERNFNTLYYSVGVCRRAVGPLVD